MAASAALLHGCDESPSLEEPELFRLVEQLIEQTHENMIFIEGGTFVMGDFGAVGDDGTWRPYFPAAIEDDKPHKEWVNDCFSKTYYQESDGIVDPQGPAQGTEKVVRNLDTGSLGFSFSRIGMPESLPSMINDDWVNISEYTFRCAVPSPEVTPQ